MISVERKYLLLFFIRWEKFFHLLDRFSKLKGLGLLEKGSPILLLGPFLGRKLGGELRYGLPLLLLTALFIGEPFAALFTLALGLMGTAFYFLGSSALKILFTYISGGSPLPGVGPLIPGVEVGPFYIPFVEGWLSILLIFILHEGAHGVTALRHGIKIRDAAMVLLGIIPVAAYVQPDEEQFKKAPTPSKVKILSMGPLSNTLAFIFGSTLLLALLFLSNPYMEKIYEKYALGVKILEVPDFIEINGERKPSLVKGLLEANDVIVSINDTNVYTLGDVIAILRSDVKELNLLILRNGEYISFSIENKGYLGVKGGVTEWRENPPIAYNVLSWLLSFLGIFSLINLMVAVVNALPFSIFDGGQAIEELKRKEVRWIKAFATLLLLLNVLPWFI